MRDETRWNMALGAAYRATPETVTDWRAAAVSPPDEGSLIAASTCGILPKRGKS